MQHIKFESIEDFLDYLPDYERKIVDKLRMIVFECIPECREKLAYNVPYYYCRSRICFIWPSSIPWGNVNLNGVKLGFCRGYLLKDEINYLEKGHRKKVFTKTFYDVGEIETNLIRTYIYNALEVEDIYKREKRIRRRDGKKYPDPLSRND